MGINKISKKIPIIGLLFGLISCNSADPPGNMNAPVPVNVSQVKKDNVIYYDAYPATVVALKEVELRCEVGGDVKGIFFKEGQQVRQGQLLYEIDRSRYQAIYQQAKAHFEIAKSNLERVQKDADRYTELSKQDAIAQQRLDNALTDLQNARLQLVSAKAELVKAETELNYSVIHAPFDGTIGISKVRMGALIAPDQTLLNTISSDDPMAVDIVIDEKEISRFQQFEKESTALNDSTFKLILSDNSGYPFYGKIHVMDRAVDPQTGTIRVRITFPNKDRVLRPGMTCNIKVLNENGGSRLVIPFKAVMEQMGEFFVYLAKENLAKQTKVSLGARIGENVIVKDGLNEGDQIVIDGIQRLREGSAIQIGPAASGGSNAGHK